MARIEPALHEHFAKAREAGVDPAPIPNGTTGSTAASAALSRPRVVFGGTPDNELSLRPFAKVNSVVVGSPADTAGLKAGDEILRFGDVDRTSPDQLARVAAVTGRNEGVRCPRVHPESPLEQTANLRITYRGRSRSEYCARHRAGLTRNTWSCR